MTEQARKKKSVRALALELLLEAQKENRQSHLVLRDALEKRAWLTAQDRAFLVRLFEGTIEYRIQMDYILNQYARIPTGRMRPAIREILRMSVYQIRYMDSVPDSAAVNEAVRLASAKGFGNLRGFVNGILRSIIRDPDRLRWPSEQDDDPCFRIQILYSMPEFLVRKWMDAYGPETAEKICRSFLEERPLTVRVRGQAAGEDNFQSRLPQGCTAEKSSLVPDAWYLKGVNHLASLPDFQSGTLYAQDVSSMLAVRAAGIRPGSRVLDMCAAPGGKSILAADLMREADPGGKRAGVVISRDVTGRKLALLRENRERCQVPEMQPCLWDATQFRPEDREAFDVVIADVPCSGYGVIGRKPDIRYHASAEKEASLAELQKKILANAVRCVRPGGTLLFSTCTVNRAENEDNTAWLLEHFPLVKKEERQLLPGSYPGDGFYYAVFRV